MSTVTGPEFGICFPEAPPPPVLVAAIREIADVRSLPQPSFLHGPCVCLASHADRDDPPGHIAWTSGCQDSRASSFRRVAGLWLSKVILVDILRGAYKEWWDHNRWAHGIEHVGIAIGPERVSFWESYAKILHLTGTPVRDIPAYGLSSRVFSFGLSGNASVEIISPVRDDSVVSRFLKNHGDGIHHIAIRVARIDSNIVSSMRKMGLRVIEELSDSSLSSKKKSGGQKLFIHPQSLSGVLLELITGP